MSMSVEPQGLLGRKRAIEAEHGAWTGHNIALPGGVWTMDKDAVGPAERNVKRLLQVVGDLVAPRPLADLRVLDLACMEGAYGIEFAQHGAEIVAVEGRESGVVKTGFASEALGLERFEVHHADVRTVTVERFGQFDVVLCLGILYHLDAPEAFDFLGQVARLTRHVALFETQVGLAGQETVRHGDLEYRGIRYEEPSTPWASIGNRHSFWPTRASLFNAVARSGFTSTMQIVNPVVPDLAAYLDHVTLVALRGEPATLANVPAVNGLPDERWPERLPRMAHPAQGGRHVARHAVERLFRRTPKLFRKSTSAR